MFEGQRSQGRAADEMVSSEVKIGLPRLNQQSQSLLYELGELSRPYPRYSSLMSNHAAQRQNEALMHKTRVIDMYGVS